MLEARFSHAEFAANLALVDQGEGGEEYVDPVAFFRITYATEGLRRVLGTTVARLAGKGGDPVIGLQTNFGGGKTHTMLALARGRRPRWRAADAAARRGTGQHRYRNALVFAAADESSVRAARDNACRERAWQSILDDRDLMQNQTQAQARDAEAQTQRSREALRRRIRGAWVHHLHPAAPDEGEDAGAGYVVRSARLVNRGGARSIPEAVWEKVCSDGTVTERLGPQTLLNSLDPVWPPERPHVAIEELRDWFASYCYLPRLRDEVVLDDALRRLVEDMAYEYAFVAAHGGAAGAYDGVVDGKALGSLTMDGGLLVRRGAIPPGAPPAAAGAGATADPVPGTSGAAAAATPAPRSGARRASLPASRSTPSARGSMSRGSWTAVWWS